MRRTSCPSNCSLPDQRVPAAVELELHEVRGIDELRLRGLLDERVHAAAGVRRSRRGLGSRAGGAGRLGLLRPSSALFLSRAFCRFKKLSSYFLRSSSPILTPSAVSGLCTKKPSRMNHWYSRRWPHIGMPPEAADFDLFRSSRMYCWSFFQFSSRRSSTSFMKVFRSAWVSSGAHHPPRLTRRCRRRSPWRRANNRSHMDGPPAGNEG